MRTPSRQLLGLTTLFVVLASALPLGSNRPLFWLLLAIVVFALFTIQMLFDFRNGLGPISRKALMPMVIYVSVLGWACIQAALPVDAYWAHPVWSSLPSSAGFRISADPIETRHHVVRLATYAMVFWIALRSSRTGDFSDISIRIIAVFVSLVSAYGILSVVFGTNPILGEFASNSVSATFVNRNNFATFAVIGLLANVAVYMRSSSISSNDPARRLRDFLEGFFSGSWVFAIGVLICLGAIFFSESRAGFAAALLGLATYSALGRRKNSSSLYAAVFVGLLVSLSILAFSSGTFTRMFAAGGEDARFLIYPLVIEGISDRPWLGHGLGAFHDAFRPYVSPELSLREIDLAHSSYLENLFELGLPAGAAFYLVLVTIVAVIHKGAKLRRRKQRIPRFAFAVAAAVGFHAFFDFSLQIPAIATLFAYILGLGWSQSFSEESACKPSRPNL